MFPAISAIDTGFPIDLSGKNIAIEHGPVEFVREFSHEFSGGSFQIFLHWPCDVAMFADGRILTSGTNKMPS